MRFLHPFLFLCGLLGFSLAHAITNAEGEEIPSGEPGAILQVVQMIEQMVRKEAAAQGGHAYRDAHRKAHGCIKAQFKVLPNLPPIFAQGLFKEAQTYEAILRFSNGQPKDRSDYLPDGRGMAIKVLGVAGEKLLLDEASAQTQDFLLINHPVFFVRNANDYVEFQRAVGRGPGAIGWWVTRHISHEGQILVATASKPISNPLNSQYWSMTASKYGRTQAKFSARPCQGSTFKRVSFSRNFLRENMENHLERNFACFDFMAQLRIVPERMPIEDATVEWSENISPFRPVARIIIPKQKSDAGEACEVLSYTPWHSLAEHRPLGGIQRVRKEVYQAISILRHQMNGQVRVEP